MASVDVLSGGRLIFGIGIGYLKAEFDALGISFEQKGARSMEYLDAILAVWTQDKPRYTGRFASFAGIQSLPRPVQKPHPPIVIGGMSPQGYRRAVTRGNGWYGYALDVATTAACIESLRAAEARYGRPPELGPLEITVTPRGRPDLDTARRFADLGVHRLVVFRPRVAEREVLDMVHTLGEEVVPRV
jgi:alkanesulfonate monooxygenase SsuD/methylene tetrahydromethanopterin reductase-like flavin-dependent oxidoreductase (luciferase family)